MAKIEKTDVGAFVEKRSRRSAESDVHGVWKPMLKTSSPQAMAERMHLAFNRYFRPSEARPVRIAPGRFDGELAKIPSQMAGLYVHSTMGWVGAALSAAGANGVKVNISQPADDGALSGVAMLRIPFSATWS
jgi:hypothetical protein